MRIKKVVSKNKREKGRDKFRHLVWNVETSATGWLVGEGEEACLQVPCMGLDDFSQAKALKS